MYKDPRDDNMEEFLKDEFKGIDYPNHNNMVRFDKGLVSMRAEDLLDHQAMKGKY